MKKTIFTVAVPMQDQTQCDRMKAVCLENGLETSNYDDAFTFNSEYKYFAYGMCNFWIMRYNFWYIIDGKDYTQVTEAEFLELLKEYKLNK